MTEEKPDASESRPEETRSTLILSGAERLFVRMTLWQTILSVVGIFIAVVALYAALKESAAVRQQTAAAVWPFVQLIIEDYDTGDEAAFAISFMNAGVGPAKVDSVVLELNGESRFFEVGAGGETVRLLLPGVLQLLHLVRHLSR